MNPTLDIPLEGETIMAGAITDLSPNVSNQLLTQMLARNQEISAQAAQGVAFGVEALRLNFQTRINEVGTLEGRAVSGVNATPLGPPSTG